MSQHAHVKQITILLIGRELKITIVSVTSLPNNSVKAAAEFKVLHYIKTGAGHRRLILFTS